MDYCSWDVSRTFYLLASLAPQARQLIACRFRAPGTTDLPALTTLDTCHGVCKKNKEHSTRAYENRPRQRVWDQVNGKDECFEAKIDAFQRQESVPSLPHLPDLRNLGQAAPFVMPYLEDLGGLAAISLIMPCKCFYDTRS